MSFNCGSISIFGDVCAELQSLQKSVFSWNISISQQIWFFKKFSWNFSIWTTNMDFFLMFSWNISIWNISFWVLFLEGSWNIIFFELSSSFVDCDENLVGRVAKWNFMICHISIYAYAYGGQVSTPSRVLLPKFISESVAPLVKKHELLKNMTCNLRAADPFHA